MAQFLKSPDHVLASNIVHSHVYFYILLKLHSFLPVFESIEAKKLVDDDGEEVIQKILDESNNKLRMYGSAKEIVENIKIFRSFPESFRLFHDYKHPLNATPIIYESLNGEKYLCKPDVYTIIQNIALHAITHQKSVMFHLLLAKFLKSKIMLIGGPVEFVKFDEKMFDEIEKEMREGEKKSVEQASAQRNNLEKFLLTKNYAAIVSKVHELNPTIWDDDMANALLRRLQSLSDTEIETKKEIVFGALINSCIMNRIEEIMAKRATLFISTPESSPITVRLFEDGEERYVMKAELYHALNRLSTGPKRFEIQSDGFIYNAMSFEDVKADSSALRFFAPNTAQYIFGIKLFQYVEEWPLSLFQQIHSVFDSNLNNQYFINLRVFNNLKKSINATYSSPPSPPPKDVRNAKKDGFTVQNLKNELKHLGLEKHFPEISDHAEIAHTEVMELKKERFLRTCDLYDAVEICQLRCIFNRVPELRIFLHHQKSCWRVLELRCDYCTGTEPFYENGRCEISIFAEAPKDNSIDTWLTGGRPVYKPIPERFKTVSKPYDPVLKLKTEKIETKTVKDSEKVYDDQDQRTGDVDKESEAKIEILRQKLMEKEEEIVNFKRDALIHEKTVKGFKELKEKIVDLEAREKEMIEARRRDAVVQIHTGQAWKADIVRYEAREKELIEERTRNELTHSKTVLENERLMRENASIRSNLKDSNERIKSEIDIRDKEIEKLGKKVVNYEKKQMNDESIRAKIEKENEELKKKIDEEMQKYEITIEQLEKENQDLKGSNELYCNNFNSINETVYRERQTFGTVQQQLVERISELERELISRNQPGNIGITDWIGEKRVMQEEIAEKTRQIAQVIESNVVLRTENEMNSRMVQNLLDRLSGISISSGVAPTPPPSGPSTSSWNRQNPTTRDSELEDVECVICLIDIKQRQKTIKCHQCRRRFHSKCASDWLKVKSECPACRGRLLDPHEFPAL
ncbi:hypothetical protein GCK72_003937 [Caenorhabditis remanei]|uniref:RING-type domain-containing protein n=1 Tax=Caenorhabditis remanei TaxID=31234 RepID=A0A6A5HAU3_CAERE|nr:hypothetical protein GCK72_003937 [Caenorhabditis remanei]KAF1763991.1 hypothetical protein GCK72_003937 [Caenorhabditis remanei]